MSEFIKKGTTSKSIPVEIFDSSVSTGAGKTGLAYNTSGLTAYYWREGGSPTQITLATLSAVDSAYSSGGFKEVDATNMPGLYRLDVPNAAFASGAGWVTICLKGATNMAENRIFIKLTDFDPNDAVRMGLTALPNATAGGSGGLVINGSNTDGYLSTEVTAIKAKTDNLPSTPASSSDCITASGVRSAIGLASANLDTQLAAIDDYIDTEVAAIKAKTDNLPATPASSSDCITAAGIRTAVGLAAANLDTQLSTIDDFLDTEIAAIKAKTDNLPATPASSSDCLTAAGVRTAVGLASANLDTQLAAIDDYIDSEVSAIKTKTDALPSWPTNFASLSIDSNGKVALSNPAGIQKNAALSNFNFVLVDSSGVPVTGATVTATRSIDGGSFASCTNSASEVGSGVYKINLAAGDLNGDVVTLKFAATGASTRLITIFTEP